MMQSKHFKAKTSVFFLQNYVVPPGLEPGTYGLENRCSIRLSYGTIQLYVKNRDNILLIAVRPGFEPGVPLRGTAV